MFRRLFASFLAVVSSICAAEAVAQAGSVDLSEIVVFTCEDDPDTIILQRLLGDQVLVVESGRAFGDSLQGGREVGEGVFVLNFPGGVARLNGSSFTYADSEQVISVPCKRIDTVYQQALEEVLSQDWVSSFTANSYPIGSDAGALLKDAERVKRERDEILTALESCQADSATDAASLREQLAAALAAKLVAEAQVDALDATAEDRDARLAELTAERDRLAAELDQLRGLLDSAAAAADEASQIRIENLGQQLNQALARAAAAQKRCTELDAAK